MSTFAHFRKESLFYEETGRERISVCMAAISAQQWWQHSMSLAANLLLVIDTGGRNAIVCDLFGGISASGTVCSPDQQQESLIYRVMRRF